MRFKADENISRQLVQLLFDHGHDAQTVAEEGLAGAPDARIAAVAAREQRMILTTDRGFADVRAYPPGTHAGIVCRKVKSELRGERHQGAQQAPHVMLTLGLAGTTEEPTSQATTHSHHPGSRRQARCSADT